MKINRRREAFAEEYLIDLNPGKAAIRAGYKAKNASQMAYNLLKLPEIQEAIELKMAERSARTGITQDYVLNTIKDTIERCRQIEPVRDKKGNPVFVETPDGELAPAFTFQSMAVLKGSELLGKHLKMFTDKVELKSKKKGEITPDMDPKQAAQIYAERMKGLFEDE